jgi:anti-sigma factor RsiW
MVTEIIAHVLGELSNYLNGSLTRSDRKRVEVHLQECDECRRHCEELSRLRKMVYPPPVDWRDRIPVKTLIVLAVAGVLYLGGGKIRKAIDLPKSPSKPASPAPSVAKPAPRKEEPAPAAAVPAAAPASSPTRPEPPAAPVPAPPVSEPPKPAPRVLPEWQGQFSNIDDPRTVTIESREEWALLWQEHHLARQNPPALPELDFKQLMVVGVYGGRLPAGSPSVKIDEIRTLASELVVRYSDSPAIPNSDPTVQQIQPYHLRAIPRTSLTVRFERLAGAPAAP